MELSSTALRSAGRHAVRRLRRAALTVAGLATLFVLAGAGSAAAATPAPAPSPSNLQFGLTTNDPGLSRTVVIVLVFALATLAPAVLLLMTSFTRFFVVLLLTRNALGLQGVPPNQVLIGLSLFLTFFIMGPAFTQMNHDAIQPAMKHQITWTVGAQKAYAPLQAYMDKQVKPQDVALFTSVAGQPTPKKVSDVPPRILIPAFVLSELRTAFLIGFIVFVPFLVIDLVVSSSLMSLGMVMLPPVVISLPLKLLLFVLVDGWGLLIRSMLMGAKGG